MSFHWRRCSQPVSVGIWNLSGSPGQTGTAFRRDRLIFLVAKTASPQPYNSSFTLARATPFPLLFRTNKPSNSADQKCIPVAKVKRKQGSGKCKVFILFLKLKKNAGNCTCCSITAHGVMQSPGMESYWLTKLWKLLRHLSLGHYVQSACNKLARW